MSFHDAMTCLAQLLLPLVRLNQHLRQQPGSHVSAGMFGSIIQPLEGMQPVVYKYVMVRCEACISALLSEHLPCTHWQWCFAGRMRWVVPKRGI
jgi:hypothetical protein